MITYNGEDFQSLIKEGLVLVDFYAEWCGPCKMLMPVVTRMSENMTDVKFVKIDVDKFRDVAKENGVKSVPTLVLFKDGVEVNRRAGFATEEMLKPWLEQNR